MYICMYIYMYIYIYIYIYNMLKPPVGVFELFELFWTLKQKQEEIGKNEKI